ncbi:MAG: hypothetical protein JWQ71_4035, partial [Pedosphaera sp.]|nr:hypothetical protein [Pedosphaera sp.]
IPSLANFVEPLALRQHVVRAVDQAGRGGGYVIHGVAGGERLAGVRGAERSGARGATAQVGLHIGDVRRGGRGGLGFQGPLLLGPVQLAQVVDAGVLLRGRAGAHEVGDGDGRQQTDDGHHDHDFHEREARFGYLIEFHI